MKVEFLRDDGERLIEGWASGFIDASTDDLFPAKSLRTSLFSYAGADGGQMVKQFYSPWQISFNGYIRPTDGATDMRLRRQLLSFFQRSHYYTAIFTEASGRKSQARNGWLSTAPSTMLRGKSERGQTFSLALTFGDPYLYEYAEDERGNVAYAVSVSVPLYKATTVGAGYVYNTSGYAYTTGGYMAIGSESTTISVNVESAIDVMPVWVVTGPATNPAIRNMTSGVTMSYTGTVASGQVLTVDTLAQTAKLGTANVTSNLSGGFMGLYAGNNLLRYTAGNSDAAACVLQWNGVVG